MDYRILGRSGIRVAPLALGTDNILNPTPEAEATAIIARAVDAGINLIDTSDSYSDGESERVIGKALKAENLRQRVILATKAHFPTGPGPNDGGNSRLHLMKACEDSLKRLQTDHIDLYQLHRPSPEIHLEETLGALTDLVRQGKVRYVGCSTHPAWMVMQALLLAELKGYARFTSEQPPYNLLDRRIENELVPLAQAHDLGLITWSPLAMGMLAGRYRDAKAPPSDSRARRRGGIYAERVTPRAVEAGNAFAEIAEAHGLDPARAAVAWVMSRPAVTAPIIGPRTLEQLEHLLPVLDMREDEAFLEACDALVPPGSAAADFHNSAAWMRMTLL